MKQVIVIRRDLQMRQGKAVAQGAHAAMMFLLDDSAAEVRKTNLLPWLSSGMTKVCVRVDSEDELLQVLGQAQAAGLIVYTVTDAGRTEFHGTPTLTCLAIGPNDTQAVDAVTGHLKLL